MTRLIDDAPSGLLAYCVALKGRHREFGKYIDCLFVKFFFSERKTQKLFCPFGIHS